jgi:hypothetical protein
MPLEYWTNEATLDLCRSDGLVILRKHQHFVNPQHGDFPWVEMLLELYRSN